MTLLGYLFPEIFEGRRGKPGKGFHAGDWDRNISRAEKVCNGRAGQTQRSYVRILGREGRWRKVHL